METIEMGYTFDSGEDDKYEVKMSHTKESITLDEVCEFFVKFVKACGYNTIDIVRYFDG